MSVTRRGLDDIRDLSPRDFELLIADIWQERQGWDTEVTESGADGGVDIYGSPANGPRTVTAVQAKCYAEGNKVTSSKIQQYGALPQQFAAVDSVTVVTTSSFTSQAETTAEQLGVNCIDGDDLLRLIKRYDAGEIVEWYCRGKPEGGL